MKIVPYRIIKNPDKVTKRAPRKIAQRLLRGIAAGFTKKPTAIPPMAKIPMIINLIFFLLFL